MQTSTFLSQLGETHGVVVYHANTLSPEKLYGVLHKFGMPTVLRTWVLSDSNYATAVFFAEAKDNTTCYLSLSQVAQGTDALGILRVGWMHDNSEENFARQPYIHHKCQATSKATVEKNPSTTAAAAPSASSAISSEGYVIIYWKGVSDVDRADVTHTAKAAALEVFEDAKEGGRSFFRFPSEDTADRFHSHVVTKHGSMHRCVSYANANDFALAKKSA